MKRLDLNQEPTFGRANTFLSHGLYLEFFFKVLSPENANVARNL